MSIIRTITAASAIAALSSCGLDKGDENYDTTGGYDTANPYGVPGESNVNAPVDNPTYAPAAYDEAAPITPAHSPPPVAPAYSAPPVAAAPAAIATTHIIVKGDTLWGLSRKYGVSADAIRAANGMAATDNNVRLGQTVNIPAN